MKQTTTYVFDALQSRDIDTRAILDLGVTGFELMQRAAHFAFGSLLNHFPEAKQVAVFCGKGNNAGDAYLVAVLAQRYGLQVQLVSVVDVQDLRGDALAAYQQAIAAGLVVKQKATQAWAQELTAAVDLIIDGLLGTGYSSPLRPAYREVIEIINASGCSVLSLDVPSGLSADTGAVEEVAVVAEVNVSFITQKVGLFTGQGRAHVKCQEFSDLGVVVDARDGIALLYWDAADIPPLDVTTYKHRQGNVLVVGGDTQMPGAVSMSAEAALRVGAGLVTVATRAQHSPIIVARNPEVMVVDAQHMSERLGNADLVILGPGLGRTEWGNLLFDEVANTSIPTVLDADGLYWLAQQGEWRGGELYITPHAAEAARLLDCTVVQVQQDRIHAVRQLAAKYSASVVLKGAGSVVCSHAEVSICCHGNPGMATAGMGDVLSGVIGGFLAPFANADSQARHQLFAKAVALHSAAADEAAQTLGYRSLLATDVIRMLPSLLSSNRNLG
ncbi:MAG: NAD(P)H-hydrate dehydratase [Gammaproteobacteria bacterium]|nr:NAD(P)H-hydrate dehydratase [Gammaproteobacteria bacterium]